MHHFPINCKKRMEIELHTSQSTNWFNGINILLGSSWSHTIYLMDNVCTGRLLLAALCIKIPVHAICLMTSHPRRMLCFSSTNKRWNCVLFALRFSFLQAQGSVLWLTPKREAKMGFTSWYKNRTPFWQFSRWGLWKGMLAHLIYNKAQGHRRWIRLENTCIV